MTTRVMTRPARSESEEQIAGAPEEMDDPAVSVGSPSEFNGDSHVLGEDMVVG